MLQNKQKNDQRSLIVFEGISLGCLFSVDSKGFNTQLFPLKRSPAAPILIKICALWQTDKIVMAGRYVWPLVKWRTVYLSYLYLIFMLLKARCLWHKIQVATALRSTSWRTRQTHWQTAKYSVVYLPYCPLWLSLSSWFHAHNSQIHSVRTVACLMLRWASMHRGLSVGSAA